MAQEGVTLKLERVLLDPDRPPLPAHKLFWTRVGGDILIELGYFDLPQLREALESSRQSKIQSQADVTIAGRYVLSPSAALDMLKQLQQLVDDLKSQGLLPVEK